MSKYSIQHIKTALSIDGNSMNKKSSIMLMCSTKLHYVRHTFLNKRSSVSCGTLFLMANASNVIPHTPTDQFVLQISYITQEKLHTLRTDIEKQLKKLQLGLQSWAWTPQAAFNMIAKNIHECSDRDIAILPFALGIETITIDELMSLLSADILNTLWKTIKPLIKDVHDVRHQLHIIACQKFSISNTECGHAGYKQIEVRIKNDLSYAMKYKQHVAHGLVLSYLYETGLLQ